MLSLRTGCFPITIYIFFFIVYISFFFSARSSQHSVCYRHQPRKDVNTVFAIMYFRTRRYFFQLDTQAYNITFLSMQLISVPVLNSLFCPFYVQKFLLVYVKTIFQGCDLIHSFPFSGQYFFPIRSPFLGHKK